MKAAWAGAAALTLLAAGCTALLGDDFQVTSATGPTGGAGAAAGSGGAGGTVLGGNGGSGGSGAFGGSGLGGTGGQSVGGAPVAATIYQIQTGTFTEGTRVAVASAYVSAQNGNLFWAQEETNGAAGLSEVAFHGITVDPATTANSLEPGDAVRFDGWIYEINGNTTITDASFELTGDPDVAIAPYQNRDGAGIILDELEGVLVQTAGLVANPPDVGGRFLIFTCDNTDVPASTLIAAPSNLTIGEYHWVTGVLMTFPNFERRVLPRSNADIDGPYGDDVCL